MWAETSIPFLEKTDNPRMRFFALFLLFMMFYFTVAALVEKYKPKYGHQTGATILLGVAWSFAFY